MEGNTETLIKLIQTDPLILERTPITPHLETPLHVATMLGHESFAVELLNRKPGLAGQLDRQSSSPLHLAAAGGHVAIAKRLLMVDPDACYALDRDGRNPIHIAAAMGRVDVLREMVRVRPESARERVKRGGRSCGTVLHLCVEYGRFEALKIVLEDLSFDKDLVNGVDQNGNTVLHLAVADKQVESNKGERRTTANHTDSWEDESLPTIEVPGSVSIPIRPRPRLTSRSHAPTGTSPIAQIPLRFLTGKTRKNPKHTKDQEEDWLERKRSGLMVVASLIATMAFQAGVNPPNNVWQEIQTPDTRNSKDLRHYLTKAINHLKNSERFYLINTTSFIASLSIILLLMSGLPLKRKFFVWVLMVVTWIAITAIALSYTVAVIISTPPNKKETIDAMVGITVFAWICLMALLLVGHTLRLIVKMIRVLFNLVKWVIGASFRRRKRDNNIRF
ncbi:hypothetical protein MIMGU_mgv1a020104mg [Erythranthe guttata]|uniref:PGG domain-containing protein n=1 Tax=Erythranthe guttata TaxID=4155 RepID=A0A022RMY1_ERYGU|nr:hypothetical protein MIMGU_mgv1a020104mg [Erythranthe guttata]